MAVTPRPSEYATYGTITAGPADPPERPRPDPAADRLTAEQLISLLFTTRPCPSVQAAIDEVAAMWELVPSPIHTTDPYGKRTYSYSKSDALRRRDELKAFAATLR